MNPITCLIPCHESGGRREKGKEEGEDETRKMRPDEDEGREERSVQGRQGKNAKKKISRERKEI